MANRDELLEVLTREETHRGYYQKYHCQWSNTTLEIPSHALSPFWTA